MDVGKTIANLRKAKNMTQSEVANLLGVSYQAVSKWERNESMPDITLLPSIADLFGVSIDQLLRGGFEVPLEQVNENIIVDESSDLNNKITEFVDHEFEKGIPTSDSLADKISHFVEDMMTKTFSKKSKQVDNEILQSMLMNMNEIDDDTFELLVEMASHASLSTCELILEKLCNSELEGLEIAEIILYFNDEQISKLLTHLFEIHYDQDDLLECLPFLKSNHINDIIQYFINENIEFDLDEFMPFLNDEQINHILFNMKNFDKDTIFDCAPFINETTLDKIVQYYLEHDDVEDLDELYPFLSTTSKKALMDYYMSHKMLNEISDLLDFID